MTGPEHYTEAERLLQGAKANPPPENELDAQIDANTVAAAQVHATLALTASNIDSYHKFEASPDWSEAIS